MRRIINLEDELRLERRKQALKEAGYKCTQCGIKKGSFAVQNGAKKYNEVDEFEANFLRENGVKVVKIFLRVLSVGRDEKNPEIELLKVLCPLCSQQYIKDKATEARKKKIGKLSKVRIEHISEVRNYVFNCTGKMLSINDAIGLYMRVHEVLSK